VGNPFSHLSASLSARDSLFNQAQWAVESLKRMLSPLQTPSAGTPIKQQHFAMVSYQLPVTHRPRPPRTPVAERPFADCPTCYLYYDHSQLLAHCHKFPQVFAVRPIRKSESGKKEEKIFLAVCEMFVVCLFALFDSRPGVFVGKQWQPLGQFNKFYKLFMYDYH